MAKHTSRIIVAVALLGALPAVAQADGIVPSIGKGVGNVVEGTGEALFGTDDKDTTKVTVKDRNPDVVVEQRSPDVVVADPAPSAVVVDRTPGVVVADPVVVDKSKPDVEVNVNN
jgi:hypothetical protein